VAVIGRRWCGEGAWSDVRAVNVAAPVAAGCLNQTCQ